MSLVPLSLVLPTLGAATSLPATLARLLPARPGEILVVDGGSRDGTVALAESLGCRVLTSPPGRGRQLGLGARAAKGDWLLFLHADTLLSPDWAAAVEAFLARPGAKTQAAFFTLAFDSSAKAARRVERLANWRARRLGLPYGDQGLLISRELYDTVGGFPAWPLFEDVDLVRRLGRKRLHPLAAVALTSARRYEAGGWFRHSLRNLLFLLAFLLGLSPERLARGYR